MCSKSSFSHMFSNRIYQGGGGGGVGVGEFMNLFTAAVVLARTACIPYLDALW